MADPVSLVVSPIMEFLIQCASSLIVEKYLLVQGLNEEVKKLESHCSAIGEVLRDAEEKQLKKPGLKDWLRKLKDAAYDAEDLLDTFSTEAYLWNQKQQQQNFLPPLMTSISKASTKYDMALEIRKILARLDEISLEKEKFDLNILQADGVGRPETEGPRATDPLPHDVEGREDDKNNIIKLLQSDDSHSDSVDHLSVIPIMGMGGLGKTTLAQLVYNDESIKNHFGSTMWICVSINFDLNTILEKMVEQFATIKCSINSPHLQAPVDEVLQMGLKSNKSRNYSSDVQTCIIDVLAEKRFLLVLDDVWTEDYEEWDQLHRLLKGRVKGSKVLVTCRSKKVADLVGTTLEPYNLSILPEDKCWTLFQKIAFKEGYAYSDRGVLEEIGKGIVHKCGGLPLAVRTMGSLLRGKTNADRWREVLRNDMWEIEEEQNRANGTLPIWCALKLSYDYLSPLHRQCFAYCSIFPKAHVLEKKELVRLWLAEGYIQPITSGRKKMEELGNEYFDHLFERSFFQISNAEEEKFKMHDLIHDLAQSISRPYCCQVLEANKHSSISENSRHISLLCKDVQQPAWKIINKKYSKVRTLLLPSEHLKDINSQVLDKMFHTLRFIRVLDLSSSTIKELPKSVEELKLLRHLDLSKTDIEMLPKSICNLSNLQTLKLSLCRWLFELPKDLGNLINLRHLELDEMFWYKLSTLPPRVGRLTSLHNLHVFPIGNCESGYGINELKDMMYLTGSLHISKLENVVTAGEAKLKEKEHLRKVVLEWSNRDVDPKDDAAEVKVLEDLEPNSEIEELKICNYKGSRFPTWMKEGELLTNLVRVSLNYCTKCRILSLGPGLPKLRQLYIKGMHDLKEWPEAECPFLDTLKISDCPKLRVLPPEFLRLRVLKIKKCDSLTALPLTPSLMFLSLVDNLVLEDWHEVRPSFALIELKITHCPRMQALPKIFAPQKLEISGCELLTTLPAPEYATRLQQMALDACHDGTLVRAIPDSDTLFALVISNISNLISFPKWPHLPQLESLYIHHCEHLVSLDDEAENEAAEGLLGSLTSLTLLSIRDCPKLLTLPGKGLPITLECLVVASCPNLKSLGFKELLRSLTSLKDLYIEDCPMLQSLPEDGLPTSLHHLRIHGSPMLEERCRKENGGGPDWTKIMQVPDLEMNSTKVCLAPLPVVTKRSSAAWCHPFRWCRGIDTREQEEENNSHDSFVQRDKGRSSKGKTADLNNIEFLEHKNKKKWVDEKSGNICFMVYPRSLYCFIRDGPPYWIWNCFKETSDDNIEVTKLSHMCWLDINGQLKISDLSAGVEYEIVWVVKLSKGASGWERPIELGLSLPNEQPRERGLSLLDMPRAQWFELNAGNFKAKDGETGHVSFYLHQIAGQWKRGIIIKGIIIRPKN